MTPDEAIENAARLLKEAELDSTNLPRMERYEKLADSWVGIATLMRRHDWQTTGNGNSPTP